MANVVPELLAHRGWRSRYPENSRIGIDAALRAGAPQVEFDVQVTRDGVPVVIHDPNLLRTGGIDLSVTNHDFEALRVHNLGEAERLGDTFGHVPLASLTEIVELFDAYPRARAFVEIKRESAELRGVDETVALVVDASAPIRERCTVISFVERATMTARRLGAVETGWCLNHYDDDARRLAEVIAPDWLLCDWRKLPTDRAPWEGPWRWAVYEVADPALALELAGRGVDLVETFACGDMLEHPELGRGRIAVP